MQEKEYNYNGRTIFYRTKGSGPLIVLLHGFGEDGTIWKNQFDLFPNHQLIVPDLPGSGRSEAIEDMSMEGLAEAIAALIKGLTPDSSPHGEGSESPGSLDAVDDSQKVTGHYFKTADTHLWKTTGKYGRMNRKNPTKAEDLLWQNLRNNKLGVKVRRQHSIGGYVVDFAILEIKVIIEVDGGYHDESEQKEFDRIRQDELQGHGYSLLRFSNEEVLHGMHRVLQKIRTRIAEAKMTSIQLNTAPLSARRGVGGEALLIGHSMGGYIALAFAHKYPEQLSAFGLFHSTAFADSEERKQKRREGIAAMKASGAEAFLKNFVPGLYSAATKEKRPALIDEHLASVRNFSTQALVNYFEAMIARPDRTDVLRKSTVPVLFVMGKQDANIPVADVLKQCHLPQTAYIHLLNNSAHAGMMEEAEEANEILKAFVKAGQDIAYT